MRTTEIYDETVIIAVRVVRLRDNIDHNRSRVLFVCCRHELQVQAAPKGAYKLCKEST